MGIDGVGKLSEISGIPEGEVKSIMQSVLANLKLLKDCEKPHDFSIQADTKRCTQSWKCSKCGGVVDSISKAWYEKGLNDGRLKDV